MNWFLLALKKYAVFTGRSQRSEYWFFVLFCLYVHHTDAAREWAYDRESHIGKLDNGLDEAKARGWTVVSIKDDWKKVFAYQ